MTHGAAAPGHSAPLHSRHRRLTLAPLVMVMFFTVCGGPYGLEDVIGASGPGMGLLLILLTPLIWSLPIALMVGELASAMPVEGGYYAWVKKALGPFWGFQEGWWSWVASFVDMAIYPVLFAEYLQALLNQQFGWHGLEDPWAHWGVALAVIWGFAGLNIRGARAVGRWSSFFGWFVLAPFAVLAVIGIARLIADPVPIWEPFVPPGSSVSGAFGVGLFVVMWNYLGWDGASTILGEVEAPRRTYPRAIAWALPLVTLTYFLPVVAGLGAAPQWERWTAGYFPEVAAAVGGTGLGAWVAIGGLVSVAGLFNALLLSISRLPFVMAADGYLPRAITATHPRFGTPWVAIAGCAVIYSVFALGAFASLVVVDVILCSAALLLEFAALIALRRRHPDMRRPLRVPGGWPGVLGVTLCPVAVLALAIASTIDEEGIAALYLSIAALASGPLAYPLLCRFVKKGRPDVEVPIEISAAPG